MHQDLMFIPRKGTRRGSASRGEALVQLAALPNQRSGGRRRSGGGGSCSRDVPGGYHAVFWPVTRAWHNTTSLFKTFYDPAESEETEKFRQRYV